MQLAQLPMLIAAPVAMIMLMGASCSRSAEPTSAAAAPPPAQQAVVFDFEKDETGQTPAGFTEALTGGGGPVEWRVQEADDAPSGRQVVAQLSDDRTNARYPQVVRDDFEAKNVDVSVRFKTISGEVDASGGLVFRYKDKDNFYVVRANSLEGNVVAYKTENGKRSNIGVKGEGDAYGVKTEVPHQQWNTLRVIMKGNLIEVFLNDRKLFEVENDTFTEAGKVGLWTKADAVTQFDDLRATSLDDAGQTAKTGDRLTCTYVDAGPTLDGKIDDNAWKRAVPLTVTVTRALPPNQGVTSKVSLRCVRTDHTLFIAATWDDPTHNVSHKSWVWNESAKAYEEGKDREDMFAAAFEHTGPFDPDMLAGIESVWDVWHWKAFRTNPQGYAMDKMHRYALTQPQIKANSHTARSGETVWIARPEDKGDTVEKKQAAPGEFEGDRVPQHLPGTPTDSAADVRAKGAWNNGRWTLELSRKLNTGQMDDTAFNVSRIYSMAIGVFDETGDMDKGSELIHLVFLE